MKALGSILVVLLLMSAKAQANNLPPEAVIEPIPNRSWLYTGEWAFFNGASSYDRDENGNSITSYYWHIRIGSGSYVQKSSGSSASNYHVCFELGGTAYATTSNGCIAMGSSTTATVRLKVYDDEGSYDYDHSTITIKTPAKSRYFITDHLGNIRTTIDEDGQAMGADDYFPFGLVMPGRSNTTANANDLYKYTSHERDEEAFSDVLDYMLARNYDPMIGRMNQIDPMAHVYSGISPYAYALNTPMNAIDPDGRLVIFINGQHSNNPNQGYWKEGFVSSILFALGEKKTPYFRDGALGGWHNTLYEDPLKERTNINPKNRERAGAKQGMADAKAIFNGLSPGENVTIISHSMGGSYALGYARALYIYALSNNIDPSVLKVVVNIDMFQAGSLLGRIDGNIPMVHLYQGGFSMNFDFGLLANKELPGAANDRQDSGTSHSHDSFMQAVLDALAASGNGEIVWNQQNETWEFILDKSEDSNASDD